MRIKENVFKEGDIQIRRMSRKALRHVHFDCPCDIILTELSKKKKKMDAFIINVHGPVYYPDGSRRYDKQKSEKKNSKQ